MKRSLAAGMLIAFFSICGLSQIKHTENTLKLADGQSSPRASIADMAWLAGNWTGTGLDGVSEEVWTKPGGGTMAGTYRLVKDDKPVLYEMMLMIESEGSITLRLKHFTPSLVGWEEKDKTVDFKLVALRGKRMYFSGLTYENAGGKTLNIYLALKQKDGTVHEEVFNLKRTN